MAISHICLECGFDVARIRARREPRYGLMIVQCPRCGRAAARRRHPLSRRWRTALRIDAALTGLFLQICGIMFFTTATTAGAITLGELVFGKWQDPEIAPWRWPIVAAIAGVLPMATGTWLGAAFAHWRGRRALIGWGSMIMLLVTITSAGIAYGEYDAAASDAQRAGMPWTGGLRTYMLLLGWWWGQSMVALASMICVTMLTEPLGRGPRWVASRFRSWRWGWRRRRRREGKVVL